MCLIFVMNRLQGAPLLLKSPSFDIVAAQVADHLILLFIKKTYSVFVDPTFIMEGKLLKEVYKFNIYK